MREDSKISTGKEERYQKQKREGKEGRGVSEREMVQRANILGKGSEREDGFMMRLA